MRKADIICALCLLVLAGLVARESLALNIGWGINGPEGGFFPFWLALIMIVACGIIILQTMHRPAGEVFVSREQLVPVLQVLWPAAALVLLMHFIGLYVVSALYIGFYMKWVGRHSWISVIALSIAIPVVTFLTFELWFLVPLPKGPLENWLGY